MLADVNLELETADFLRQLGQYSDVSEYSSDQRRRLGIESEEIEELLRDFKIENKEFSSLEFSTLYNTKILFDTLNDLGYKGKNFKKAYNAINDLFKKQVRVKYAPENVDSKGYIMDFDYTTSPAGIRKSSIFLFNDEEIEIQWNPQEEPYEFSFESRSKRKTRRRTKRTSQSRRR